MIRLVCEDDQRHGDLVLLNDDQQHYLGRVMRRNKGDSVEIKVAQEVFEGQLTESGTVRLLRPLPAVLPLAADIALYQSLLKQDHFSEVVERATEAGVAEFFPIVTERSQVRSISPNKMQRWTTIAKEATEQCLGAKVPKIHALQTVQAIALPADAVGIMLDPYSPLISEALLVQTVQKTHRIALVVGPEGGLAPSDKEALTSAGFISASLGNHVFRAENAGAFATVTILALLNALGGLTG